MLRETEQAPVSGGEAACMKRHIRQCCRSWPSETTAVVGEVGFMAWCFGFVFDGLISGKDTTRNETAKLFFSCCRPCHKNC